MVDAQPITLGKLFMGIFIFGVGFYLLKKFVRQVELRFLSRLEIEDSLRFTLKTALFYILLIILVLFILHLLNVPITIFTVLGGALAIGVGFGSQNIVNNFISGLIILTERPVRVSLFLRFCSGPR